MSVFGFVLRPCSYSIPIRIHAVLANELVYIPFPTHAIGSCLSWALRRKREGHGSGTARGKYERLRPGRPPPQPLTPTRARAAQGGRGVLLIKWAKSAAPARDTPRDAPRAYVPPRHRTQKAGEDGVVPFGPAGV